MTGPSRTSRLTSRITYHCCGVYVTGVDFKEESDQKGKKTVELRGELSPSSRRVFLQSLSYLALSCFELSNASIT